MDQVRAAIGEAERVITGHIDFLQVRNGCVHLLDYKPDARTNKPIAQLPIYALTRLVPGLKLFDIKCAWFNEEEAAMSLSPSQIGASIATVTLSLMNMNFWSVS